MRCGLVPPHGSALENLEKNQKASNRWARKTSGVSRRRSKQDPGLGDEPSCPYQFHVKEAGQTSPALWFLASHMLSVSGFDAGLFFLSRMAYFS
jgi:hypothetical protein